MNDVVDVVKMFLGGDKMVVSPDLGREIRKSRFFFREIQVLVNFCFIIWPGLCLCYPATKSQALLSYFAVFRADSLMVYLIADLYH